MLRFVSYDPAGQASVGYQREYTVKDHLGNLRLAYRAGQVRTLTATLEPGNAGRETQQFDSLSVSPPIAVATPYARTNGWAAVLNAGGAKPQPLGPLTQLGVQKGDTVNVTAYGLYPQAQTQSFWFSFVTFLANLVGQPPPPPTGVGADPSRGRRTLPLLQVGVSTGLASLTQLGNGVPKGYLRVLVFNKDSVLVEQHIRQLSQAALQSYESLQVQLILPQDGYVTAYVGNEGNVDVFFDDVTVEHRQGLQVQENQYEPWGLNLAGIEYSSPGIKSLNGYQFNGKEVQGELGLNWTDYGARHYDKQLGRWVATDPLADKREWVTTYNFVQNNPLSRFDPNGLTDFTLNKETGEVKQVGKPTDQPDRILRTDKQGAIKTKKNGEPRVDIAGIEHGILKDGQNFKREDNIIQVGGEGQPSVDGVKSFTLQLSEYIAREIKGFSYSGDASGKVTDMLLGKYQNNSLQESHGGPEALARKYGSDFSLKNVVQEFHTHPDGKLGATESSPEISTDVRTLQGDKPQIPNANFIILYRAMGQAKPKEYDYTHEYRPQKK